MLNFRYAATFVATVVCAAALAAMTPVWAETQEASAGNNALAAGNVPTIAEAIAELADSDDMVAAEAPQMAPAIVQRSIQTPLQDAPVEPTERYSTLAAAVADQDVPASIDDELNCLAVGVYYESKGEPLEGQLAVAEVLLNRTTSGRFPKSICSVLTQRGQFSFVRGGAIPRPRMDAHWRTAVAVAQVARDDEWDSSVSKALFFHARRVSPGWRMSRLGSVGNHVFYR